MFKRKLGSFFQNELSSDDIELKTKLSILGIQLDISTGHLFYHTEFKPINLDFELVFVRHGETYGNCGQSSENGTIDSALVSTNTKNKEQRIYQGVVDTEINQLTEYGKQQALDVAKKLNDELIANSWSPDRILLSPLTRAQETALPFIRQNNFEDRCIVDDAIKEMSFGSWDNRRVCDIQSDDPCHSFYQEQHALVKNAGINGNGVEHNAENFCDVLLRAHEVLIKLNAQYHDKKIIMFSHSMFGAACAILLGRGQTIEDGNYLAFDGKKMDGTYYTIPNATPVLFHVELPCIQKTCN